ncbi:beta-lactamase domain-containing protein [Tieghemostelium lacteum]|uniref:Beta-lactamase domain-containing protein n=1 Tax=Tieghemostelium lacteum TaxID=361077 RepID=A0A151ZJA2_TIELA|nr:beta-lactamase domain-containing protein [Tieghemostelium lacteum]|eukprot:KYQ93979.1 beta-lactamase domain-containing protein [Tieghemostelium lacteum]
MSYHHNYHYNPHHHYQHKRPIKGGTEDDDILEVMPIGSGKEVGRSCVLLKYKGKTIMFDCGVHPAYSGINSLPFFDTIVNDIPEIDLLLVSHFHLDHSAAVPYFVEKTEFKGEIYMTHATKDIFKILLSDYVKVSNISTEELPFNEQDLNKSLQKINKIGYKQKLEHNGIKFSCYNAGHVLGAAMFLIEIAGVKILYTGDFSRQEDRHLMGAETPPVKVDLLIIESTYGVQVHEPRLEREKRFTGSIHDIVLRKGGRCLIPVFALGRAQELLLILDEYWIQHPELQNIPIYYASALAKKCMKVYAIYINVMNERIKEQFNISNPFDFKFIKSINGIENFVDNGPCVFMASPGMLQSGLSRQLFERWCSDKRNGVVIPGYTVEGTLAKHIMSEPKEITRSDGINVPLSLSVTYVSFSAHSDFIQTSEFIQEILPPHIILVHGEATEMDRLKHSLNNKFRNISVLTPKNSQNVQLEFKTEKYAKILGMVASEAPKDQDVISGILVTKDFTHHIMSAKDLHNFTNLKTSQIKQKQTIPFAQKYQILYNTMEQIYYNLKESEDDKQNPTITIFQDIIITYNSGVSIGVEWLSNPVNDMVVDSIIALIIQIESNPLSLKIRSPMMDDIKEIKSQSSTPMVSEDTTIKEEQEENSEDIVSIKINNRKSKKLTEKFNLIGEVKLLLEQQFGTMTPDQDDPTILHFNLDESSASIHLEKLTVESQDAQLKQRFEDAIKRIKLSVHPIGE